MIRIFSTGVMLALTVAAAGASAQDSRDDEARALFDAANAAYGDGRFDDAEGYFRRSYELSGRTELLYNVALSAEQARHDDIALDAYRSFVEAMPTSERASRARTRIAALEDRLAGGDGASADVAPAHPVPGRSDGDTQGSGGSGLAGPVLIGVGGAAVVAGVVLVGLATSDVASVENAERGTAWSDVSDAYGRSEAMSVAGFVTLGVGLAAAAAGVVLVLSDGGADENASAQLRVGPSSLSLEGTF